MTNNLTPQIDIPSIRVGTHPPTEPFELSKGVVVLKPALWWTATRRDIAAGPNGPRARYGSLQQDLQRLVERFGNQTRITQVR